MKRPLPRFFLAILALFLLTFVANAQDDPPTPGVTVTISASENKRVRGLSYDSTVSGGQAASFTFSVPAPQGGVQYVHWKVDDVLVTSAENSLSCTYKAVGVGKHTVTVKVLPNAGAQQNGSLTFAAIGGPLNLGIVKPTGNPETFVNDRKNKREPFYLQYFDYGHASPPTDARVQKTQDGTATVALSQLTGTNATNGTKMEWEYGALYCPELTNSPSANLTSITLQAESAAIAPITVKCKFTYKDPVDATLTGSAYDDTAVTPQPGFAYMMVNKFSIHRPDITEMSAEIPMTLAETNITLGPGEGFSGSKYKIYLYDHLGDQMPGVWVQERFTSVPTGTLSIEVNSDADFWTTQMPPTSDKWDFYPSGIFMYDYIWVHYPAGFTGATAVHHYWAATKAISTTVPGGIDVGTWQIMYGTATSTQQRVP